MGAIDTKHSPRLRSCASLRARQANGGAVWTLELSGEADLGMLTLLREDLAVGVGADPAHLVSDVAGFRFCDCGSAELIMSVSTTSPVSLTGTARPGTRAGDLLDSARHPSHPVPTAPVDRSPP